MNICLWPLDLTVAPIFPLELLLAPPDEICSQLVHVPPQLLVPAVTDRWRRRGYPVLDKLEILHPLDMHFAFHNGHACTSVSASPHLGLAASATATLRGESCVKFLPWSIGDQWAAGIYRLAPMRRWSLCLCNNCSPAGPDVNKE